MLIVLLTEDQAGGTSYLIMYEDSQLLRLDAELVTYKQISTYTNEQAYMPGRPDKA